MDFPDVFTERLETYISLIFHKDRIYTHPKAAAAIRNITGNFWSVSTHSRAEAAATYVFTAWNALFVSTHSRAEAAAH